MMTDSDLATKASAAIDKCAWEAYRAGDTSAASAYWAAANLINATFNREVTP